jgi:heterodisulfide reductase subunit A-like polyferredoxin
LESGQRRKKSRKKIIRITEPKKKDVIHKKKTSSIRGIIMQEKRIETDVLCIGGGIAGLMAAIRAAELGVKVVVAEKGNVLYSGCGRMGNDHFETYIPKVHGKDKDAWIEELLKTA